MTPTIDEALNSDDCAHSPVDKHHSDTSPAIVLSFFNPESISHPHHAARFYPHPNSIFYLAREGLSSSFFYRRHDAYIDFYQCMPLKTSWGRINSGVDPPRRSGTITAPYFLGIKPASWAARPPTADQSRGSPSCAARVMKRSRKTLAKGSGTASASAAVNMRRISFCPRGAAKPGGVNLRSAMRAP